MSTETNPSREDRRWNRLSDQMKYFHDHFKHEFNTVYELADGSFNNRGMPMRGYLRMANGLSTHLNTHHMIEETYLFPILAKRMPAFSKNAEENGAHIESHKAIHKGLDDLGVLIKKWNDEPSSYSPTEMRACLDGFRAVLFRHLDEEVEDLGMENMKKYWTLEEVDDIQL